MTERKGFTLAELLIAVLIFGFMITSLATIYATANKHMFQQYRGNAVKSTATMAMKDIVNSVMAANRIDSPAWNAAGNILAVAVNVDQNAGCRISSLAPAPVWHYFCLSNKILYHHTGLVTPVPPDCPSAPPDPCSTCFSQTSSSWYPVPTCGSSGGTTITQLSNMVTVVPGASGLFSRKAANPLTVVDGGVYEKDQVKILLRLYWDPVVEKLPGKDLTTSARLIDVTLSGDVKINRSVN